MDLEAILVYLHRSRGILVYEHRVTGGRATFIETLSQNKTKQLMINGDTKDDLDTIKVN